MEVLSPDGCVSESESWAVTSPKLGPRVGGRCLMGCGWESLVSSLSSCQEQPHRPLESKNGSGSGSSASSPSFTHHFCALKSRQVHCRGSEFHIPGKPSPPAHWGRILRWMRLRLVTYSSISGSFLFCWLKRFQAQHYIDIVGILIPILQVKKWRPRKMK